MNLLTINILSLLVLVLLFIEQYHTVNPILEENIAPKREKLERLLPLTGQNLSML